MMLKCGTSTSGSQPTRQPTTSVVGDPTFDRICEDINRRDERSARRKPASAGGLSSSIAAAPPSRQRSTQSPRAKAPPCVGGGLLRVARNDAGHPTGVRIDEDTARAHLLVAAGYLGKMTELRAYFEAQSPEADRAGGG